MKIRIALTAAAVAVAVGMPAPAVVPEGTLTATEQLVTWADAVDTGFINPLLFASPAPEIRCIQAGACDTFKLKVSLGDDFWANNGDGAVEVAIRWVYDGVMDLDLQVLDANGALVDQSAAVDSNAENVFVPNAANGVYTVRVIPSNTFNPENRAGAGTGPCPTEGAPPPASSNRVCYQGLAQVEILATDSPEDASELLPNLRAKPPGNFHISSALNLIPFPENPLLSCYAEETVQRSEHPTRCLRFDQIITNVGEGPMLVRFGLSGVVTPDTSDNVIVQRISWSDGSYKDEIAPENYVFHEVHAHFHYQGFGQSILYPWNGTTGRGPEPVSVGQKNGFCMIDVQLQDEYWGKTGNGARAHTFPFDCILPDDDTPPPDAWVEEGIAVGWADVYGWNLADQYIDITNVPDGLYELVQLANPNHSMRETTDEDNCASTVIAITGDLVTMPNGPGSAIDCPTL